MRNYTQLMMRKRKVKQRDRWNRNLNKMVEYQSTIYQSYNDEQGVDELSDKYEVPG